MAEEKAAKPRKSRKPPGKTVIVRFDEIAIDSVSEHPDNPNVNHNLDALADSLDKHTMYKPIVVQNSTNLIVAGNHTWKGAKRKGWGTIWAVFIDVDDEEAAAIMVDDNRLGEFAYRKQETLARVLAKVPEVKIAGYTPSERSRMIASLLESKQTVNHAVQQVMAQSQGLDAAEDESFDPNFGTMVSAPVDIDNIGMVIESEEYVRQAPATTAVSFDQMDSTIEGTFQLNDAVVFPSDHPMGYPPLLGDMFVEDLPDNLKVWVIGPYRDMPQDGVTWFYNYGTDSTAQIQDLSKIIMAFYTDDDKFECWWESPAEYVGRAINCGIESMVTPDFSLYGYEPPAVWYWNLYRSRWIGRFAQEAGIRIIPNICVPNYDLPETAGSWEGYKGDDMAFFDQHVMHSIPKGIPVIAVQYQTFNGRDTDNLDVERRFLQRCWDMIRPETLLVYSGIPGRDFVSSAWPGKTLWVPSRNVVLKEAYGKNTKPTDKKSKKRAASKKSVEDFMDEPMDVTEEDAAEVE